MEATKAKIGKVYVSEWRGLYAASKGSTENLCIFVLQRVLNGKVSKRYGLVKNGNSNWWYAKLDSSGGPFIRDIREATKKEIKFFNDNIVAFKLMQ